MKEKYLRERKEFVAKFKISPFYITLFSEKDLTIQRGGNIVVTFYNRLE